MKDEKAQDAGVNESRSEGEHKKKRRLSSSAAVLLSLGLGLTCGILFGDYCAVLQTVGDAYIALLQMTVLPYIMVALIVNIGNLTLHNVRDFAVKAGMVLVALWAVGFVVIGAMIFAFPEWHTGSFFSTSLLEPKPQVDYVALYIPSNPFKSAADSVIPAVVLFSISIGVALMALERKQQLIDPLSTLLDALSSVNRFVATLTPIGVFALTAAAAGTLTLAEVGRLQGYLLTFVVAALLLTYWVLPTFVGALTPFTRQEIVAVSKTACITAFATDNVFIVLPSLIGSAKELCEKHGLSREDAAATIDVVLPVAFTFPNLGKLLALLFVPFGGWFTGAPLSLSQYPSLAVAGLLSLFGKVSLAMPYLLDLVELPADLFRLFLLGGLFCARFGSLVAAMSLFAFALLATSVIRRLGTWRPTRILRDTVATAVVLLLAVGATRAYLTRSIEGAETREQVLARIQSLNLTVDVDLRDEASPNPVPLRPGQSRLERIRETAVLRIGFEPERMPFSFFDADGNLIGFDVELAHALARDLNASIVFVPCDDATLAEQLAADHFDLAMSGVAGSVDRYQHMLFSEPYVELTPALVVRDHRREELGTFAKVRATKHLRLAMATQDRSALALVKQINPDVEIVEIGEVARFFTDATQADALVVMAEIGSAWTLRYPEYSVVMSATPTVRRWPVAYPVGGRDRELADFLNGWLRLKRTDGSLQSVYDRWILGRSTEQESKRWSVIRDVLGWVD